MAQRQVVAGSLSPFGVSPKGALRPVIPANNRKKNRPGLPKERFYRDPSDQANMHGSRRGAIENTIRKQWLSPLAVLEPCSICRAVEIPSARRIRRLNLISPHSDLLLR